MNAIVYLVVEVQHKDICEFNLICIRSVWKTKEDAEGVVRFNYKLNPSAECKVVQARLDIAWSELEKVMLGRPKI